MRTVAAVLALVACVHAGLWVSLRTKETAPEFSGQLASVSYSPPLDPEQEPLPPEEKIKADIRADLKALAPYTKSIRTYSATRGAEFVPPIAAEFGLKVAVGAWIGKDKERNKAEIRSALELARHNGNVNAIYVGNEAVLTRQISADDLIGYIREAKRLSPVPVTTGESENTYKEYPQARLVRGFHRRARAAVLGRCAGGPRGRLDDREVRHAAPPQPRQACRHRRVRLAERRTKLSRR